MKYKTATLDGIPLDYMVALCYNLNPKVEDFAQSLFGTTIKRVGVDGRLFVAQKDWSYAGPMLTKLIGAGYSLSKDESGWVTCGKGDISYKSENTITAILRCYVATLYGDEVEVPYEG